MPWPALDKVKMDGEDETIGVNIVRKALEAPIRKLAQNAGQDGAVIIENVRRLAKEQNNKHIGYNVITGEYADMLKAGVIDPLKVVRGALENAASIAAMILTTECLITDVPEKEKPVPHAPRRRNGLLNQTHLHSRGTTAAVPLFYLSCPCCVLIGIILSNDPMQTKVYLALLAWLSWCLYSLPATSLRRLPPPPRLPLPSLPP